MNQEIKKQRTNKTTLGKYWLTHKELTDLSDNLKGEAKLMFQIMSATGQRFEPIKGCTWQSLNTRLNTIEINGFNCSIPVATSKALATLRESAKAETDLIFKKTKRAVGFPRLPPGD